MPRDTPCKLIGPAPPCVCSIRLLIVVQKPAFSWRHYRIPACCLLVLARISGNKRGCGHISKYLNTSAGLLTSSCRTMPRQHHTQLVLLTATGRSIPPTRNSLSTTTLPRCLLVHGVRRTKRMSKRQSRSSPKKSSTPSTGINALDSMNSMRASDTWLTASMTRYRFAVATPAEGCSLTSLNAMYSANVPHHHGSIPNGNARQSYGSQELIESAAKLQVLVLFF